MSECVNGWVVECKGVCRTALHICEGGIQVGSEIFRAITSPSAIALDPPAAVLGRCDGLSCFPYVMLMLISPANWIVLALISFCFEFQCDPCLIQAECAAIRKKHLMVREKRPAITHEMLS